MRSSRMWKVGMGCLHATGALAGLAFELIGCAWGFGHVGLIPRGWVEPIAGGIWLVAGTLVALTFLIAVACLFTAAVEWASRS